MRKSLTILIWCAGVMIGLPMLHAQEPQRTKPAPEKSDEPSVAELQKQLQDLQRRLAEQGPWAGARMQQHQDPASMYRQQFQHLKDDQQARVRKLQEQFGGDHPAVKEAQRTLELLTQQERVLGGGPPEPGVGPFAPGGMPPGLSGGPFGGVGRGFGGAPAGVMTEQYRRMLDQFMAADAYGDIAGAAIDPAHRGRQMVIDGLQLQFDQMAREIRAEHNEKVRADKTQEFRGLAQRVIEARAKHRHAQIEKLEAQLVQLRKEESEVESVDAMIERLLRPSPESDAP